MFFQNAHAQAIVSLSDQGGAASCSYGTIGFAIFLFVAAGVALFFLIPEAKKILKKYIPAETENTYPKYAEIYSESGVSIQKLLYGAIGLVSVLFLWLVFYPEDANLIQLCFSRAETTTTPIDPFGFPSEQVGTTGILNPQSSPTIILQGNNPERVIVGSVYEDPGVVASLHTEGDKNNEIKVQGLPIQTNKEGIYTVMYYLYSESGQIVQTRRTVIVESQKTSSLLPPTDDSSAITPPPGDIPIFFPPEDTEPISQPPPPQSTDTTTTDNEAPVLTLRGNEIESVVVGGIYSDLGAQAYDEVDGSLTFKIITAGFPINTSFPHVAVITYSVTDTSGNKATITRTINITETPIDVSTDVTYIRSCFGRLPKGACAMADVNGNGKINKFDEDFLIDILTKYDVNNDFIIELDLGKPIVSCFFKTSSGCASDTKGSTIITLSYLLSLDNKLGTSAVGGVSQKISLSSFLSKLGDSDIDQISYWSIAQYDFNGDGIADASDGLSNKDFEIFYSCIGSAPTGACAASDINRDGTISLWDKMYLSAIQSNLLPSSFTISQFENSLFDKYVYTDARIINHCAIKNLAQGACTSADINNDGRVDSLDLNLFNETTRKYDFNNDGVINGQISF